MYVYIVSELYPYEGSQLLGVFSDVHEAAKYAQQQGMEYVSKMQGKVSYTERTFLVPVPEDRVVYTFVTTDETDEPYCSFDVHKWEVRYS